MNFAVVWLDAYQTKIFHFSEDRMERDHFFAPFDLQKVLKKLASSSRILILGQGDAKDVFFQKLQSDFDDISKKVIACEGLHEPTDSQIASYAMKYLQKPVA